jgi:16S rRNA (guanine(966)-N(2))-methyltransferase RsmD
MRVIAGSYGGRRLRAPAGRLTRPTSDRVREALFSILGPLDGAVVLDLFAGSGALGIEALSRGAAKAVFVERDHAPLMALRRNIKELGLSDRATILGADVCTGLRRLAAGDGTDRPRTRFSWIFLDPPYVKETEGVLAELSGSDLLTPCAVVVLEHDRRNRPPESVGNLFLTDRRQYGDTELSFFRSSGS